MGISLIFRLIQAESMLAFCKEIIVISQSLFQNSGDLLATDRISVLNH
jgi:hypothetical protein